MYLLSKIKQRILNHQLVKSKILTNKFKKGYKAFLETGITSPDANMAFINLYCLTNGKFNETINAKIIADNPPVKTPEVIEGVIGKLTTSEFTAVNDTLNRNGYIDFHKKLPPQTISNLYQFALKTPAVTAPLYDSKIIYNEAQPVSEIYRFNMADLINNEDIQELIMDPALINVARNYLGCEPIFDFPAMWWSTAFSKEASSEAAQLYHFDMDRIKWLKIFIYLNDVTPENGPHCYVEGSHLPGSKPEELLKRGYVRINDDELKGFYKKEKFKQICAEAGSMFAGDTRCWHKGSPLKKGHRLVLELEYTCSMFGANYPKFDIKNATSAFKNFCEKNKIYASNFRFVS